jgi:alkylation response protein AidB-like acyl-CoA dehydrogenase
MDLELTDEQAWLGESIDTLLAREWVPVEAIAEAGVERRSRVWNELVAFGALSIGDGIGAVEACLIARSLGGHLASVPFAASAAARLALPSPRVDLPDALALGLLEPGASWSSEVPASTVENLRLTGEKVAIEQLDLCDQLVVSAAVHGEPALVIVPAADPGVIVERRASLDDTLPMFAARFEEATAHILTGAEVARLTTAGTLLAAAEAIGAATRVLDEACRYATQRRQFGRTIGSFQALRHLLADM